MGLTNILIFNKNPEDREFYSRVCQKIGFIFTSSTLEKTTELLQSTYFSVALIDAELAEDSSLNDLFKKTTSILLTGRDEERLKEAIKQWPPDRFIDYLTASTRPQDLNRSLRILMMAQEYSRLKSEVLDLMGSRDFAERKLKKVYSDVKEIGSTIRGSLIKELEKRIILEARYLWFQKLKEKFENILKKLYAANDVSNLLDIVYDIKGIVQANGITIYILEESETLGKYLKPLVWDDMFLTHAEFAKHITPIQSQDFAAYVARTGEKLSLSEIAQDRRYSKRYQEELKSPLKSLLITPLKHKKEVIGVMEVYNKTFDGRISKGGFTKEDQQILLGLSEHISIAMTKLNLIQYDALTALLRPDPFLEKVIQKIETWSKRRREEGFYALVMGDVDWFKNYNDRNGHEAGNRLLRELSGVLKSSIREEDLLCRYGGEEFLFFLSGVKNIEEAILLTERIRKNIEDHYFTNEEFQPRNNLTMSFGVTFFPREKLHTPETFTKNKLKKFVGEADLALAEAKGKKLSALKLHEKSITKNKVCAYLREKASVVSKTSILRAEKDKLFPEKRKYERYYTSTLLIYKENGSHKVASTINLSLGGAKISAEAQFPLARLMDIFLILGSAAHPLKGEVVYSQRAAERSAYFYTGLKFRSLSFADQHLLENYFLSLEKKNSLHV
ncbi:MAG: diguanylate cyclase [Candidatus Aminicenantales bacterium]